MEDRIISYLRKVAEFVVYAGLRFSNQIDFTVHAASHTPSTGAKARDGAYVDQLYLLDTWKRELSAKFEDRLADLIVRRASARVTRTELQSDRPTQVKRHD